jgi:hypothetical protein
MQPTIGIHPLFMALPLARAKNGKRTRVGKKHSCNQWHEATCIKRALVFFFFWGRVGVLDLCCSHYVPMKFFLCSHRVGDGLPTCSSSSQCVPQHVPNTSSLDPISFALSSTLVTQRRRFKHIYFGIVQILIF